jgi:hypothetical protein
MAIWIAVFDTFSPVIVTEHGGGDGGGVVAANAGMAGINSPKRKIAPRSVVVFFIIMASAQIVLKPNELGAIVRHLPNLAPFITIKPRLPHVARADSEGLHPVEVGSLK